jgi:excisionase family DNA binding protein
MIKELPVPNTSERWLSVDEIAAHLGISAVTIYRWLEKGGIPAHRVGKLWKFKRDEVDAWVKQGGASKENTE